MTDRSPTPRRVVIVGGSLAGLHAAEELRAAGYDGSLTLVSAERRAPYDRPPLSKQVLTGEWPLDRAALRSSEELAALQADVHLGVHATALDVSRGIVTTDAGLDLPYDGLILATGCAARSLRGEVARPGLHTLRTDEDSRALRRTLLGGGHLVVAGAGFIGMEVAAAARALGADVTVVEPWPVPMQAALGDRIGTALADLHRAHGVKFRLGQTISRVLGAARVGGVELSDGTVLDADAVLVGIGATPATDWLAGSGLDATDGVACDAYLAAGPPGVYAAGDLARWDNPLFGTRMRVEHWSNATEQGAAAARNLLAAPEDRKPFASVPYFWSDQYDTSIQFAGRPGRERVPVVDLDGPQPEFLVLTGESGTLTGVLSVNSPKAFLRLRRMIKNKASLADAADAARALRFR
ncbi:NAD(P)/FAD-dependent oxidoreductase [Amycolatopsis sp. NPDC001319]|uniref:NAD(P)/FAD-dependent oxidoreductase n=1 Tax=unclassified Amycolatopsis TaxID=2618356 RepID=UPI0036BA58E9